MSEPAPKTQLTPVDTAKGYPQWGRISAPATPTTPERIEWTAQRMSDSIRFRETHGGFKSEAVYEIQISVPGFPEPFTSTARGDQLNMGDPNTERQANYPFGSIGQLPIYSELGTAPAPEPPTPTP